MKLIAVIEDDEALAEVLREMLEEEGTWRVMVIADGAEALTHLPTLKADLILLDVNLPNLDGVSLYRILQGHRATCQTPILFMTASHDWQLQRQGIGPCSAPILWKPFQMDELLERVATMLKR